MKKIKLILGFYQNNMLLAFLLVTIITITFFNVTFTLGRFRYYSYSKDVYQNASLENAVYFMPSIDIMDEELDFKILELISQIEKIPGVRDVLSYQNNMVSASYHGRGFSAVLYGNQMLKSFPMPLTEGSWFSEPQNVEPNVYDVVVGGSMFYGLHVGDKIPIRLLDVSKTSASPEQIEVNIVGILKPPASIPTFGGSGTDVVTDQFIQPADIMIFEESVNIPTVIKESLVVPSFNSFVVFEHDISREEKENCLDFLSRHGIYATYDEIIENTNSYIKDNFENGLVLPVFFVFVSTVALICSSALFIQKKIGEYSIYYLCGYSRKQIFLVAMGGLSLIVVIACTINVLFILLYPILMMWGSFGGEILILDGYSILLVICYSLLTLFLSTLLPLFIFYTNSPIQLYRRQEQ